MKVDILKTALRKERKKVLWGSGVLGFLIFPMFLTVFSATNNKVPLPDIRLGDVKIDEAKDSKVEKVEKQIMELNVPEKKEEINMQYAIKNTPPRQAQPIATSANVVISEQGQMGKKTKETWHYQTAYKQNEKSIEPAQQQNTPIREGTSFNTYSAESSSPQNVQSNSGGGIVYAVINGEQSISENSVVSLRVIKDCEYGGVMIKKNTIFSAVASYNASSQRMELKTRRIRGANGSIEDALDCYDRGGLKGLDAPTVEKNRQMEQVKSEGIDRIGSQVASKVPYGDLASTLGKTVKSVTGIGSRKSETSIKIPDGYKITFQ